MTVPDGSVTSSEGTASVVATVTNAGGEVPAGTLPPVAGDVTSEPADDFRKRLETLEEDRRKQQSVYDRKIAEAEKRNRELQQQLEESRVRDMDEKERALYEASKYKQQYEELVARQEAEKRMRDYAQAFAEAFKVPVDKLDLTSEETVAQSGWQAVLERQHQLEEELERFRVGAPATTQQTPKQPQSVQAKVLTGTGGVPRTVPNHIERKQMVAQMMGRAAITDDEYYSWAERNPSFLRQWDSE